MTKVPHLFPEIHLKLSSSSYFIEIPKDDADLICMNLVVLRVVVVLM